MRLRLFGITGLFLVLMSVLMVGCNSEGPSIALSEQFGLAYAPVSVARLNGWFEEENPGISFTWDRVGNATAVREAILAGELDGGFMGIPPYLIGKDRGMPWTAVAAVAEAELGMVTLNPDVNTIRDIDEEFRIAVPQPGSIQHILLSMAAGRILGDPGRFDTQLITLNHPDGMTALLSGADVDAHFTSPPYLQEELETPGSKMLLSGNDAFGGDYTFIVAVLSDRVIEENPDIVEGIRRALNRAAEWISANPDKAGTLLSRNYGIPAEKLAIFFKSDNLVYGGDVKGINRFRDFMFDQGYLNTALDDETLVSP